MAKMPKDRKVSLPLSIIASVADEERTREKRGRKEGNKKE
jgi:hypothetical protein